MLPTVDSSHFRGGLTAAAPAGPGMGARRRQSAGWDVASVVSCTLLLVLGACTIWVCTRYLSGPTGTHGQFVGWFCCGLALLGWLCAGLPMPYNNHTASLSWPSGAVAHSRAQKWAAALGLPLRTALLVGLALGALGTLSLMDQVANDVGFHCMMAEAGLRISHLEEKVTKLQHDELLTQVFFRLQEMDDLLHEAAEGHFTHASVRNDAFHLEEQDRDLIRERVERLVRHSSKLLDETRRQLAVAHSAKEEAQRNLTAAMAQPGPPASTFGELEANHMRLEKLEKEKKQREEAVAWLEMRAEAVEGVMHYIETRSHDAHADLTFEEYQMVLEALLQGTAPPPSPPPRDSYHDKQQSGGNVHVPLQKTGGITDAESFHDKHTDTPMYASHGEALGAITPPVAVLREALTRDQQHIEAARLAFERRGSKAYDAQMASAAHIPKQVAERRAAARKEFEERFAHVYETGTGHLHPDVFRSSLVEALEALPQHCLRDETAFLWLHWLSMGLGGALILSAYTTATSLTSKLLNPTKDL